MYDTTEKAVAKLSLSEFKALVNKNDWRHTQETVASCDSSTPEGLHFDYETDSYQPNKYDDPNNFREGYGWCELISVNGDYAIVQQQQYHYTQYQPDSVYLTKDVEDEPLWYFIGFEVVEDGKTLLPYEIMADAPKAFEVDESLLDKRELSGKELDMTNANIHSSRPNTIITSTLAADICFTGNRLAFVSDYCNQDAQGLVVEDNILPPSYLELYLYQAENGNYICHRVVKAVCEDLDYVSEVYVASDTDEVKTFFGGRWIANELYKNAEI